MTTPENGQTLPEERRREIFAAIVEAQDQGVPVAQSHNNVAQRFGITIKQLREIEREGLNNTWPPLD